VLAVDHLTAIDLEPTAFVAGAARAGFGSASLRTMHVPGGLPSWAAVPFDAAAVAAVAADHGVAIHAIEALELDARAGEPRALAALDRALDDGATLGAAFLYAYAADDDAARLADAVATVAERANAVGIRLLLEPMPYRSVRTVAEAEAAIAAAPGAGVLLDVLHATRAGDLPAAPGALSAAPIAVVQLCDAPALAPTRSPDPALHPLRHEAMHDRRLPGDGALAVAAGIRAVGEGPLLALEAPAHDRDPIAHLRAGAAAMRAVLAEASA